MDPSFLERGQKTDATTMATNTPNSRWNDERRAAASIETGWRDIGRVLRDEYSKQLRATAPLRPEAARRIAANPNCVKQW